jgi:hypothetical protein
LKIENSEEKLINLKRIDAKYKQLTKEQCHGIVENLLQHMKENRLQHGAINQVAAAFQETRLTDYTVRQNEIFFQATR